MTRDHWWWRPGWRPGRSFYTWHITFADESPIGQIVSTFAPVIGNFATLDPVEVEGIHVTLQGVGFTDEVSTKDVARITETTASRCAGLSPLQGRLEAPHVDEETVQMDVQPFPQIAQLRREIRGGIADIWGAGNVPESMDGFRPHITLAYSSGAAPLKGIDVAIQRCNLSLIEVWICAVSLINLNRDHKRYEWTEVTRVPLTGKG